MLLRLIYSLILTSKLQQYNKPMLQQKQDLIAGGLAIVFGKFSVLTTTLLVATEIAPTPSGADFWLKLIIGPIGALATLVVALLWMTKQHEKQMERETEKEALANKKSDEYHTEHLAVIKQLVEVTIKSQQVIEENSKVLKDIANK